MADNDLGWALHWLSRAEEALACFDRALRAWAGYDAGTALALHGRGVVLRVLERYEESLESLERARAAWHRLGHARQEAGCLTGVGLTCQRLGRHDDAVAAHEAAIGLARDSAARVTEVMALGNLGEAHRLARPGRGRSRLLHRSPPPRPAARPVGHLLGGRTPVGPRPRPRRPRPPEPLGRDPARPRPHRRRRGRSHRHRPRAAYPGRHRRPAVTSRMQDLSKWRPLSSRP
ncbi:tetratricopeptide repeat protein [Nonomuraea ferruginea]